MMHISLLHHVIHYSLLSKAYFSMYVGVCIIVTNTQLYTEFLLSGYLKWRFDFGEFIPITYLLHVSNSTVILERKQNIIIL